MSSAGLPDNCTVVIKNLRKGDGDRSKKVTKFGGACFILALTHFYFAFRIKVFCQKRTKNLTGGFSVSLEKKNPPFEGLLVFIRTARTSSLLGRQVARLQPREHQPSQLCEHQWHLSEPEAAQSDSI